MNALEYEDIIHHIEVLIKAHPHSGVLICGGF